MITECLRRELKCQVDAALNHRGHSSGWAAIVRQQGAELVKTKGLTPYGVATYDGVVVLSEDDAFLEKQALVNACKRLFVIRHIRPEHPEMNISGAVRILGMHPSHAALWLMPGFDGDHLRGVPPLQDSIFRIAADDSALPAAEKMPLRVVIVGTGLDGATAGESVVYHMVQSVLGLARGNIQIHAFNRYVHPAIANAITDGGGHVYVNRNAKEILGALKWCDFVFIPADAEYRSQKVISGVLPFANAFAKPIIMPDDTSLAYNISTSEGVITYRDTEHLKSINIDVSPDLAAGAAIRQNRFRTNTEASLHAWFKMPASGVFYTRHAEQNPECSNTSEANWKTTAIAFIAVASALFIVAVSFVVLFVICRRSAS